MNEFEVRWMVFGYLDNFRRETFSLTASKKILRLLYVIGVMLILIFQWFDIRRTSSSTIPTQDDVYITIDGNVHKLNDSLNGLDDAAKLLNDNLVGHTKADGYGPSKWVQFI